MGRRLGLVVVFVLPILAAEVVSLLFGDGVDVIVLLLGAVIGAIAAMTFAKAHPR